jgi:hypothetical protein
MGIYKKQQIDFEDAVQIGFDTALVMMEELLEKREHEDVDQRQIKDIIGILRNTNTSELEFMLTSPCSSPAFH